ncbi:heparinase II/III family protein [uncultured Cyclobacterium sp.]|uniref:heparinase II/III domain-containing protein n=1 Tax=uncultured Cyclobacterium sp. TaxID=453820 RepID=UPI0030EC1EF8|tara:strand:- start:34458 stop:36440 length:1983 start_codon:yes stop_codon:yes gene_type:complete
MPILLPSFGYKISLLIIGFCLVFSAYSQENRNLLTNSLSRKQIADNLTSAKQWVNYPSYEDRDAWNQLPEEVRKAIIKEGEAYLNYDWPIIKASMYLEFTRTGDRSKDATVNSARKKALQALMMAELVEGKGRFLDDLVNGVFAFCEQTYWGASAHFYLYGFDGSIASPTTVLPDIEDPIIDLMVGDIASDLAWTLYYFKDAFDVISPVISRRLSSELKKKVLQPFYERNDFWWITGWGEGRVNNWTPWCNFNVLTVLLLVEEDPIKKQDAVYKSMQSVDLFINSYPDDGSCSEGPAYWAHAGGKMFDYLELLDKALKGGIAPIFSHPLIGNMGKYIYRSHINDGSYYINFADAPLKIKHDPGRILRYGKKINDPIMEKFAAFLANNRSENELVSSGTIGGRLGNLFMLASLEDLNAQAPLIKDFYFPDWDVVIAREESNTKGFYFTAKGGNNNEQHNHNDVGSFMLYYDGKPVLIDVGVGTYTRQTFSPERYSIWTMQSNYHNLPLINGVAQKAGENFKATGSSYRLKNNEVHFQTAISAAYPKEAAVKSWERSFTFRRENGLIIKDHFELDKNDNTTTFHFMSALPVALKSSGLLEIRGETFSVFTRFDHRKLDATVETITMEDPKLISNHGEELYRIVFKWKEDKLKGDIEFSISAK